MPHLFGLQNEAVGGFGIGLPPQTVHYEREAGGGIGTTVFFGKAVLTLMKRVRTGRSYRGLRFFLRCE